MAEKKPKERTYYYVGKTIAGVSIPIVQTDDEGNPIKDKQGNYKPVFKKSNGEYVYSGGAKVPLTRMIDFEEDQIIISEDEPTRCSKTTSDPYEIEMLDKYANDPGSDIKTKEVYEKERNPESYAYKVKYNETLSENEALKAELEALKKKGK